MPIRTAAFPWNTDWTMEISEIYRPVKAMVGGMGCSLIACSQLSRQVEGRPGHRPQLSDLRNRGSIERDPVMFIHRDDFYYTETEWDQHFPKRPYPRDMAENVLAKQRNGPAGSVHLRFRDSLFRFETINQG